MLNINAGHNRELMEACKPLGDYADFVQNVRDGVSKGFKDEFAVQQAIDSLDEDSAIRRYLMKHRAEVTHLIFTAEDNWQERREKNLLAKGRLEGIGIGRAEGVGIGRAEGINVAIEAMRRAGVSEALISETMKQAGA